MQWSYEYWMYVLYFLTAILTQLSFDGFQLWKSGLLNWGSWKSRSARSLPSALISAFGLSLFLRTNEPAVAVFASFIGIAAKFLLLIDKKHLFNPSALGIVVAVWLTGDAWVNPGQWGSGMVQLFGALTLGIIVVTRVQKLDISLAFLLTFASLLFLRQVYYLGWPADFFVQSISTGTVLVFSFFMISDPKTTPDHPAARIIWGIAVALLAFYLVSFRFINGAPVLALVLLQPFVPLLDRLFKAKRFQWTSSAVVPAAVNNR